MSSLHPYFKIQVPQVSPCSSRSVLASATRTDVLTMRTRSTAAWLLLLVLGSSTAPKSTRNEGMPPWGGKFVGRLERQIGRLGLQPGVFFDEWRTALTDYGWYRITLIDLKAENDRQTMTESLRALSRGQKAIEWQRAQVERLKASAWARSREVSDWTAKEMVSLLSACNVVDQQDEFILPRLSEAERRAMATDLVALLYTYWWTHESTPDDEEAKEITAQTNKDLGYPPPSQPPPMPPRAAPRQDKKATRPRQKTGLSPEEKVWQEEARQRASKLDPATAETEAIARSDLLIELLRGLRLSRRKQLPEGTLTRLASTPPELTLEEDVTHHALFIIRRLTSHDPEMTEMGPAAWEKNLGFTSAELSALAEHGVAPYQDEAWLLTCAYMGYKQFYDPTDDYHLQGILWLGKARDPSLVYRGEAEFKQVRGTDGKMHWTASAPKDFLTEREPQQPRRKKRRQKTEL